MTGGNTPIGVLVGACALAGVVAALVCVAVMRLIGADMSPAIIGGVAGGVAGAIAPTLVRRKREG